MSNHTNHEAKLESTFKSYGGAESPTTVKPFDMDDDEVPESVVEVIETPNLSGTVKLDNDPPNQQPPQAPQPTTSDLNAEETLKEAFPSIDIAVVKAVLRASGGHIEPAFNALLAKGMSDPEADQELSNNLPLSQPPAVTGVGSTPLSQLEADERYARQLANQYRYNDRSGAIVSTRNNSRGELAPGSGQSQNIHEERSFLEDDLPIIKDNLKKGFLETQNRVSNWINLLKKKIDGDDDDDDTDQNHVSTSRVNKLNDDGRRSDDFSPYDADPQVLGDDFAGIQMHSDGTLASHTYKADKFYPNPIPILSKTPYDYQTLIKTNPQKENDSFKTSSNNEPKIASKQSKWQPLSTVEPNPVSETDNDPFSLGDSDDEKETKDSVPGIELKSSIAEAQDKSSPMIKNDNILESESNRIDTAIVNTAK
ncbi:putative cue domain-containing protein [Erysiphe neolycopersici]|uniref:Putative cue domain-containing protein n=1 Tax=Erysiphe neolycopersici TaxID=212602 RepID=A0A420I0U9_9PEZI|nr:putative cue domain-containing protein [Erysiphe neolycopersici]